MPNIFDYVKSINDTKVDMSDLDTFESDYNTFVVNRAIAQTRDGIFFANEMNKNASLGKELNYKFYLNIVSSGKRYASWPKKIKVDENIVLVSKYYNVSIEKATEYMALLNEDQLKVIQEALDFDKMKTTHKKK